MNEIIDYYFFFFLTHYITSMSFTFSDAEIANYIREHVICGLCRELVQSAIGCNNCATLFCGNCINDLLSHQAINNHQTIERCPFCQSEFGFSKNVFVDKMLTNFSIECEFCQEITDYLLYPPHLLTCPEAIIACALCGKMEKRQNHDCPLILCEFCETPISKLTISIHLENDCPEIPISCQYCGDPFKRKEVSLHERALCPKFPVQCDYCHLEFIRHEFNTHYSTCEEYPNTCSLCHARYKNKDGHTCDYSRCSHCRHIYELTEQEQHDQICPMFYCFSCKIRVDDLQEHQHDAHTSSLFASFPQFQGPQ